MTIEKTLAERGDRYGSFQNHANIAQALQDVMRSENGWERLAADQRQALTVIADKIARMLNGNPTYRDNWHDIVGYAKLVDDRMAADEATEIADIEQAIDEDAAALARSIERAWLVTEGRRECLRAQLMTTDGNLHGKITGDWRDMNQPLPPGVGTLDIWKAYTDGVVLAPGQLHTRAGGEVQAVYWALP